MLSLLWIVGLSMLLDKYKVTEHCYYLSVEAMT